MRPTIASPPDAPPVPRPDRAGLRVRGRRLPVSREASAGRCATSTSRCGRASASRWWARTARARRRSRSCWRGCTIRPRGASCSMASTCGSTTSQSLRRAIGVIFQDFVRYDMRFDENIGVGEIEARARLSRAGAIERTPAADHDVGGEVARRIAAAAIHSGYRADARPALRRRRRSLGRRVAEDRARARVHARRAGADSRRADGGARRARRVRGVHALQS